VLKNTELLVKNHANGHPIYSKNLLIKILFFVICKFLAMERSIWLSKVNLNIVPFEECQNIYKNLSNKLGLVETQLCAIGLNGAGPCQGDSGGKLTIYTFLKLSLHS